MSNLGARLVVFAIAALVLGALVLPGSNVAEGGEPGREVEVVDGGQFLFWPEDLGTVTANQVFTALKIAWLFNADAVDWTSFVPALGVVNYTVVPGSVLWLVSVGAQTLTIGEPVAPPKPEPEPQPEPQPAARSVVITSVEVLGSDGRLTITNVGDTAQDLSGWFICQRPNYWPFPSVTLGAGQSITVHVASGTDDASNLFAGNGFSTLEKSSGEVAIYDSGAFGSSESIQAYVNWNGGGGRTSVAQGAGIWGAGTIDFATSDTEITLNEEAEGRDASDYTVGGP